MAMFGEVTEANELERKRAQFLDMISAYSQDHWAAGWMDGIENDIRSEGGLWVDIARACGGWPIGYMAEGGWEPFVAATA